VAAAAKAGKESTRLQAELQTEADNARSSGAECAAAKEAAAAKQIELQVGRCRLTLG